MNLNTLRFLLVGLGLLARPAAVQAQLTCTTNAGKITITGYSGPRGAVTIPGTINGLPVTGIADYAFYGNSNLTSVSISNGITSLGYAAFYACSSLGSVTIPGSVTSIGSFAFTACTGLISVSIPNSVTNIGNYVFSSCTSLTAVTMPNGFTNLGHHMFYSCPALTGVWFRGNAPALGVLVFEGATNSTVYYVPTTTGWGPTLGGRPTALWLPRMQTADPAFGIRTNQFGFNTSWAAGQTIVVESTINPARLPWSPISTNLLTADVFYFSDPGSTNRPARFYRIRSP